jgi:hypothetical protein
LSFRSEAEESAFVFRAQIKEEEAGQFGPPLLLRGAEAPQVV